MNYTFFNRRAVNIDLTHRCAIECPNCPRQFAFRDKGLKVPGQDLSDSNFEKILDHMTTIDFEGQYSDPVHHPKFIEFLEKSYVKKIDVEVHNASSVKSLKWYIKAFKAHPFARWKFAIDGLPKDSHKYRINQDGEKLFNVMKESVKYLKRKPQWQYIVFKYNQNDIDKASKMADSIGVDFYTLISSRWRGPNDPYKPTKRKYILDKGRGPLAFQKDYVL